MTKPQTPRKLAPRRYWSEAEIAVVRARYADECTADLARDLGRPVSGVYQLAKTLGVKKSAAFLASDASGRVRDGTRGAATRFQKGQAPPNKGLRRPGWHRGRMRETQFRKGVAPRNTVPVGTERIRGGYVCIKAFADRVPARKNWLSKHQHLWEQAHGPVPEGHIVRFRDNDRRNLTLENLECVSHAEHVRTRGLHTLPPEIVKVHQLRGAIMRQIHKRQPPAPKRRTGRPRNQRAA